MKKIKLLIQLDTQLFVAINMHYWKRAFDLVLRIKRVKSL